jgi:hypothetical protein
MRIFLNFVLNFGLQALLLRHHHSGLINGQV